MVNQQFSTAVHLMTSLAYHEDRRVHSDYLAQGMRTHPVVVRRLLGALSEAGLITTTRGKTGGIQLAKKQTQITLADIYGAVIKKSLLNKSKKPALKECPVSCSMAKIVDVVVDGVDGAIHSHLEKIKLSDLTKRIS
jgi:Rrf2 family protein